MDSLRQEGGDDSNEDGLDDDSNEDGLNDDSNEDGLNDDSNEDGLDDDSNEDGLDDGDRITSIAVVAAFTDAEVVDNDDVIAVVVAVTDDDVDDDNDDIIAVVAAVDNDDRVNVATVPLSTFKGAFSVYNLQARVPPGSQLERRILKIEARDSNPKWGVVRISSYQRYR